MLAQTCMALTAMKMKMPVWLTRRAPNRITIRELVMLATAITRNWQALAITFFVGMAAINYQYLVTLPRIMVPLLAHPANATRRRSYEYLMGKKAIVASSLLAIAGLAYAMVRGGLF